MEIWMKPLVFIDSYWQTHRMETHELHKFASSLSPDEFRQLVSILKLDLMMHGRNSYYVVPSTIGIKQFRETNKIIQWPKMPRKLPRTKLTKSKVNPLFRTVYEFEHFIFSDVRYTNGTTGSYELSPKDAKRIYGIIEQMKRVPYIRLHDYLRENRNTFPHRNGKIVIPGHVDYKTFKHLAELNRNRPPIKGDQKPKQQAKSQEQPPRNDRIALINTPFQESSLQEVASTRSEELANPVLGSNPHQDSSFRPVEVTTKVERKIPQRMQPSGVILPTRIKNVVTRIARTTAPITYLKELYDDTCQICHHKVDLSSGRGYSEVHHIQPLGKHNGPDVTQNMIVVCPNHHIMFDRGVITINLNTGYVKHSNPENGLNRNKLLLKHHIDQNYIDYHDQHIFQPAKNAGDIKTSQESGGNFGKSMILADTVTGEEIKIQFEQYLQREFMTGLQRAALYRGIGDQFQYQGYTYIVKCLN